MRADNFTMRLAIPVLAAAVLFPSALRAADPFDHVATIKGLRHEDVKEGRRLYALHCASCHGVDGNLTLNPLARRFAKDELKFGNDPYALWKTVSYGNGLMFRWDAVLTPKARYQIVHHLREEILKPINPDQYFVPNEDYFAKLPAIAAADAKAQASLAQKVEVAPGMIDGTGGRNMIYGPFLQHGLAYTHPKDQNAPHIENATEKALIVDLPADAVLCYDAARLSVSGIWSGKNADTEKTHHTSYKGGRCLMPGGEVHYKDVDGIGWSVGKAEAPKDIAHLTFRGHYLYNDQVVLSYQVGSRAVLELPGASKDGKILSRSFRIGAGEENVFCLVGRGAPLRTAKLDSAARTAGVKLVTGTEGGLWISIPALARSLTFTLWFSPDSDFELPGGAAPPPFDQLIKGGPRRWPQQVQTALAPGEAVEGYAADILTVPFANPWGCWMRITALDFFADGSLAVSTLSGDVWIVSWEKENPHALNWSRFAAGLYEPLGLRIVDDMVYVRGRDRITRLHDLNNDGEADYYDSFYEDRNEIGASYHAFVYDLQTDAAGNFYFSQSGYKSPLTGAVVRVDRYGKRAEFVGTDLRNPNGMGAGGPHGWITIADNPSGKAIYDGFTLARVGAKYGFEQNRNVPMLCVLPARVDSSSGGQCWSDEKRWGPLSGSIIHTSYSRCAAFYCMVQNLEPFPNCFAVRLPFNLKSGAMRPRRNPVDGQVYLACHKGWDTSAPVDGVIYRIRHTGAPAHLIQEAAATKSGIRLTFSCDLEPSSVRRENITTSRESDNTKGAPADGQAVAGVTLIDKRTIEIAIPEIEKETLEHRTSTDKKSGAVTVRVNPAIGIAVKLKAADGAPIEQTVFATINSLPQ